MSPTLHFSTELSTTASCMKCKGANCSNTTSCNFNNSADHQLLRYLRLILYITGQLLTKRVVASSPRLTSGVADLMIHDFLLRGTTYNHHCNLQKMACNCNHNKHSNSNKLRQCNCNHSQNNDNCSNHNATTSISNNSNAFSLNQYSSQ